MIRVSAAGLGLIGCCAMMARIPSLVGAPGMFLLLFFLAFGCYVAGVYWIPGSDGPRAVAPVLTVGLIARLVLLPVVPPSPPTSTGTSGTRGSHTPGSARMPIPRRHESSSRSATWRCSPI